MDFENYTFVLMYISYINSKSYINCDALALLAYARWRMLYVIEITLVCVYKAYKMMVILTSLQVKLLKNPEIPDLDSSCHLRLTLQCTQVTMESAIRQLYVGGFFLLPFTRP